MTGINTLVRVPLSIGVAGQASSPFTVLGINHLITVDLSSPSPLGFLTMDLRYLVLASIRRALT
jgi:hypothetical protein